MLSRRALLSPPSSHVLSLPCDTCLLTCKSLQVTLCFCQLCLYVCKHTFLGNIINYLNCRQKSEQKLKSFWNTALLIGTSVQPALGEFNSFLFAEWCGVRISVAELLWCSREVIWPLYYLLFKVNGFSFLLNKPITGTTRIKTLRFQRRGHSSIPRETRSLISRLKILHASAKTSAAK